jgi:hypothetical protein
MLGDISFGKPETGQFSWVRLDRQCWNITGVPLRVVDSGRVVRGMLLCNLVRIRLCVFFRRGMANLDLEKFLPLYDALSAWCDGCCGWYPAVSCGDWLSALL